MKKHPKTLTILLLCVFSVYGYTQNISFGHFDVSQGLSNNSITAIYQDFRGFLWFGTRNGVNLYNGNDFRIFKYDKYNPDGLPSNRINQIVGDGHNEIYISTDKGIATYHIPSASFSTLIKQRADAICYNHALYFALGTGIYRYDETQPEKSQEIYRFPYEVTISQLYLRNDSILIGTEQNGLYLLRKGNRRLSHLIEKGHIFDIFCDSGGCYWVTSYDGGGLYRMQDGHIDNFHTSLQPGSISSNQTHKCCEDQNGDIWVGTFDGLNKYDSQTGLFTRYYKEDSNNGLTESSIWSLYCDWQGTVWAGTYYGGVNTFNPSKQVYNKFEYTHEETQGLSAPIVGEMVEDGQQNLWMCTEGGGICCYNASSGKFKRYVHETNKNSISHNHAKALCYDSANNVLWIGTHLGGLNKLDLSTGRFTHYYHDECNPHSIPSDIIMDIVLYRGELLLSTYNGVAVFNPQSERCRPLFSNQRYFWRTQYSKALFMDHQDNLWIVSTRNGVSCYNFTTGRMTDCLTPHLAEELNNKGINGLYQDSQKRVWICTNGNGLGVYLHDTDQYEEFDVKTNGLVSDVIYTIRELSSDKYILTTDAGFSILDYPQRQIVNYQIGKEIPLTAINENSLYVTGRGSIFVGGMDGLISFFEKSVVSLPHNFNVYPDKLYINGNEVSIGDVYRALNEDLTVTRRITLRPDCETFSIQYAITDYLPYDKGETEYRLSGLSDNWLESKSRFISYSNLAPGIYTLQIRAKYISEGSAPQCSLEIEVLPPFYKTTVAYFLYILVIAIIIAGLMTVYRNRVTLQAALKYEQRHAEDVEALTQAKLRFFIDVSHEFRTPLTIILGQLEILLQQQVSGALYNSLLKVYKNCLQLKELITELLDFRKQEQGHMTIKVHQQNIVGFIYNHFQTFRTMAIKKQITYKFVKKEEDIQLWFDERLLWKVMNNLVSNAFKHTPDKGEVKVSVYRDEQDVVIEVADNGEGIASESIDKVFDRFYRIERATSCSDVGSGVGLALTKGIVDLHHGTIEVHSKQGIETKFMVRLKIGCAQFTQEELESCQPQQDVTDFAGEALSENLQLPLHDDNEVINTSQPSNKMLVVEDNNELRETLVNLFAPYYQVLQAQDGKEALEMAINEIPDIVVSDIVMPNLSGLELCREIKKNVETCHIPIILLTAKTATESMMEGLKAGADDYIEKPFSAQLLLLRCNNLLNSRKCLLEKFSEHSQTTQMELANNLLDKAFIDKVIGIVRERMGDTEFNVDMLVSEMGISRTKLFVKLKDISGNTPSEFIQDIRLKEAAQLLRCDPLSNVSEVSEKVGFSSPQYFRKCFKEKYHVTPLEYRKGESIKE